VTMIQPTFRPSEPTGGGLPQALLGYGSRGPAVRDLQEALARAGYNPGAVDGVFGGQTLEAVRALQANRGLEVDGLVGTRTRTALEGALRGPAEPGAIDTRSTWQTGGNKNVVRNFGHRPVNGSFVHARPDGRLAWSDSQTLVNRDQWAAMGQFQRQTFLAQVPEAKQEGARAALEGGLASQVLRPVPKDPVYKPNQAPAPGSSADQQMRNMLDLSIARSIGKRPDGMCYMHVYSYIERSGYGNMPGTEVPWSHGSVARQFAEYANANLGKLGLRKLNLDNPYKAPPGAIVVVRAGTPGTAHPTAGDIAIATGRNWFANGGEMGYGGPGNFPPGNNLVLGIYVPA